MNDNVFHLSYKMRLTEREVVADLHRHGYKLTPQRRAEIRAIASSQDHLTPAAIYSRVHQKHPKIGLVTIYRTLEVLAELELICELHGRGICRSYTISNPKHHHHLVCSNCGTVIDFPGFRLKELEQDLSRETGFRIDDHLLEFIGLCQNCQK